MINDQDVLNDSLSLTDFKQTSFCPWVPGLSLLRAFIFKKLAKCKFFLCPFVIYLNLLLASCQFYNPGNVFCKDLETIFLKWEHEGDSTSILQSLWEGGIGALLWWTHQLANTDGLITEKITDSGIVQCAWRIPLISLHPNMHQDFLTNSRPML